MNRLEKVIYFFVKKPIATVILLLIVVFLLGLVLRYSQCTKYETYELYVIGEGTFLCAFDNEYIEKQVVWYTNSDDIKYSGVIEGVEDGFMKIKNISDSWKVDFSSTDVIYAEVATGKRYLYELLINRNEE